MRGSGVAQVKPGRAGSATAPEVAEHAVRVVLKAVEQRSRDAERRPRMAAHAARRKLLLPPFTGCCLKCVEMTYQPAPAPPARPPTHRRRASIRRSDMRERKRPRWPGERSRHHAAEEA